MFLSPTRRWIKRKSRNRPSLRKTRDSRSGILVMYTPDIIRRRFKLHLLTIIRTQRDTSCLLNVSIRYCVIMRTFLYRSTPGEVENRTCNNDRSTAKETVRNGLGKTNSQDLRLGTVSSRRKSCSARRRDPTHYGRNTGLDLHTETHSVS